MRRMRARGEVFGATVARIRAPVHRTRSADTSVSNQPGPSLNPSHHSATRAKAPRAHPAEDWHEHCCVQPARRLDTIMARKTVAAQLVDVLAEAGVRRIYGVAGDSLNGITDSIRKSKRLEWAHMRHEEVAAFAAGAEAHLTGRLAVW